MNKESRHKLERMTQEARRLLEQEYREQLEGRFDILLDGRIALAPGGHLSMRERVLWNRLVATIAHKRSTGLSSAAAVAAYLREAAFHTLNRFVALKMLEARGLLQECVSRGEESAGYREFCGLAPGLSPLGEQGYRLYIESLFDEIGREVRLLFDRRDPASLLWPRRQAFLELLRLLNESERAHVWEEDETIGWVYQYFNGEDERRQMRAESQAPRNSRELAVRNQFFTPRYVVQFLTDNSLGRTWCEMRGADTQLADLDYLVKPEEGFDARAPKDPRDLRVLDPACGSGHFLLYAFDLLAGDPSRSFSGIYEEAWRADAAPQSEVTGRTLREDYDTEQALRRAVPELILRHNLHGVDIDPRAAQIAGLALWMRAQRAYRDHKVVANERPLIERTNIVTAEPMPGDRSMVAEFASTLQPLVLGELFQRMVEEMRLAGELGSLLRIECALQSAVAKAREQFLRAKREQQRFLPGLGRPQNEQLEFDLSGISDESFFDSVEERIVQALQQYAAGAPASMSVRRQLFAGDAAQGIAFIDLCRKRFDVVVMNPPFGAASQDSKGHVDDAYPSSRQDLFAVFVERAVDFTPNGFVGVLSTEAGFFRRTLESWRRDVLLNQTSMSVMAHLGGHVLDGATVRTAAYVLSTPRNGRESTFIRVLEKEDRQARLLACVDALRTATEPEGVFHAPQTDFEKLPYAVFGYWCSREMRDAFQQLPQLEGGVAQVRQGLATADDFRFLRLRWEVPNQEVCANHWIPFAKGGEYSPYHDDIHLLLNWAQSGQEVYAWGKGRPQNVGFFGRSGLTYPRRTNKRFAPRALPAGCAFGDKGPAIVEIGGSRWGLLALMNSRTASYLISFGIGTAEAEGGAGANSYEVGLVQRLPVPANALRDRELEKVGRTAWQTRADIDLRDESAVLFHSPVAPFTLLESVRECAQSLADHLASEAATYVEAQLQIDRKVAALYRLADSDWNDIEAQGGEIHRPDTPRRDDEDHLKGVAQRLALFLLGCAFGRWDASRLATSGPSLADVDPFDTLRSPSWISCDGAVFLADDRGHRADLDRAVFESLASVPCVNADAVYAELSDLVGSGSGGLRGWLSAKAFDEHLSTHSKSRRRAPLYWQLSTPSTSYSVWCYYPRLTRDSLFRLLNEIVAPKAQHEASKLAALVQAGGPNPSRDQRSDIDAQEAFVDELRAFESELARVAPLWNPRFDDGVLINFAPLWRLVPQSRSWQRECKNAWDKLAAGDYDWAHLAMHLWPERVVPKCIDDRSLAIAHGLENVFWHEDDSGAWCKVRVADATVQMLIGERTSAAVKAALREQLSAATPAASIGRKAKGRSAPTRTSARKPTPAAKRTTVARTDVDDATLRAVKAAITSVDNGASKADVLAATGLSDGDWNKAIAALLGRGEVTRTGQKRGTRYHAAEGGER